MDSSERPTSPLASSPQSRGSPRNTTSQVAASPSGADDALDQLFGDRSSIEDAAEAEAKPAGRASGHLALGKLALGSQVCCDCDDDNQGPDVAAIAWQLVESDGDESRVACTASTPCGVCLG
eukprot:15050334-Alexandrium_andersonii.AAC.1